MFKMRGEGERGGALSERLVRQKVRKNTRQLERRIERDGGKGPLAAFALAAIAHQLAENPPTPTTPDCGENAPNALAPNVTAPTLGPK